MKDSYLQLVISNRFLFRWLHRPVIQYRMINALCKPNCCLLGTIELQRNSSRPFSPSNFHHQSLLPDVFKQTSSKLNADCMCGIKQNGGRGLGVLKWRHTLYKSLTFLDFSQSKRIRQLPKIDANESSWVETENLQRRGSLVPAYYFLRVCIYTINDVCLIAKHEAVTEMGIQYKPCAVISHAILHGCPDLSWNTRSISGIQLWIRSF